MTPTDTPDQKAALDALEELRDDMICSANNEHPHAETYPFEKRKLQNDLSWIDERIAKIKAALMQGGVAVPDGWKLVPIEPTEEMMMNNAKCQHHKPFDMSCGARSNRMRIWKAMIAAAPQPPREGE